MRMASLVSSGEGPVSSSFTQGGLSGPLALDLDVNQPQASIPARLHLLHMVLVEDFLHGDELDDPAGLLMVGGTLALGVGAVLNRAPTVREGSARNVQPGFDSRLRF